MALRLKIVSDKATAGEHARWTFGVNGGRIGRHATNDWVLRDHRTLRVRTHAEIEHRGGTWLVRDTSTNGTFVNDSDEALGPDRLHQLANGDRIRIGEYDIEVEITGGNDFPARNRAPISETDLDASFEVKNFISTGRRERDSARARPARRSPPRPVAAPPVSAAAPPRRMSRAGATTRNCGPGSSRSAGAPGIDPLALPTEVRGTALQQAGQLLRETLVGFTELARTRADFASEFGITSGARRSDATSPLVQIAAVEPVLETDAGRTRARGCARGRRDPRPVRAHAAITRSRCRQRCAKRSAAVFEKLEPG